MQGSYTLLQDGGRQGGIVAERQFSKAVLRMKIALHALISPNFHDF